MTENRFHAREAAAALLKMARATSDPKIAAGLIEAAADLKEQSGELPLPLSARAPDVQTDSHQREALGHDDGRRNKAEREG